MPSVLPRTVDRVPLGWLGAAALTVLLAASPGALHAACTTSICAPTSATSCTIAGGPVVIDDDCVLDLSGQDVTIERTGILETQTVGQSWTLRAGSLTLRGRLAAQGGILTLETTAGAFRFENVQNSGKLDVRQGGTLSIVAAGDVTLGGDEVTADGVDANPGGSITVSGVNVSVTSPTHANGSGGEGGYIEITASGNASVAGALSANGANVAAPAAGGTISIKAAGTLDVTGNLVAEGGHDGDGGVVELIAGGAATLAGNVHVDGEGGSGLANGGKILVEAASASILGAWTATGNAAAQGGDVVVRTLLGAISTATTSSITVDGGTTDGGEGGSVELEAATDATVRGAIRANGGDAGSTGGDLALRAGGTLTVSGALEAISTANDGARNGTISLGPACAVVVSSRVNTRNPGGAGCDLLNARVGGNTVIYGQSLALGGSQLLADPVSGNRGGNTVLCACRDTDANGDCDTPATCAQGFSQTGATVNPAPVVDHTLPASCP